MFKSITTTIKKCKSNDIHLENNINEKKNVNNINHNNNAKKMNNKLIWEKQNKVC